MISLVTMNRLLFIALILFFIPLSVKAEVKVLKCIDGDTVRLVEDREIITVRLLAIDTPELSSKDPYATIASNYTCNALLNANQITLETDPQAKDADRYGRKLRWVYADDQLLQNLLVKRGYAKVAYLYADYSYVDQLLKSEQLAQQQKLGIWKDTEYLNISNWLIILIVIIYAIFKTSHK